MRAKSCEAVMECQQENNQEIDRDVAIEPLRHAMVVHGRRSDQPCSFIKHFPNYSMKQPNHSIKRPIKCLEMALFVHGRQSFGLPPSRDTRPASVEAAVAA